MKFSLVAEEIKKNVQQFEGVYQFDDVVFVVRSNEQKLIHALEAYFKEWIKKDAKYDSDAVIVQAYNGEKYSEDYDFQDYYEVGKKRVKEQFYDEAGYRVVLKTKTGVRFASGNNEWIAFGPLLAYSNQLINFMNAIFMEIKLQNQSLLFHAAGVYEGANGIVIAAKSGKGKSTTSLKLLNASYGFVSNDRVVITKLNTGYKMIGVPKHPRVNPGTLLNNERLKHILKSPERFEKLSTQEIWDFEEKYDVLVDEVYGAKVFKLSANAKALLIIDWGDSNSPTSLKKLNLSARPDLLPAIMKTPSLMTPKAFEIGLAKTKEDYLSFLADLPCYIIEGQINTGIVDQLIRENIPEFKK